MRLFLMSMLSFMSFMISDCNQQTIASDPCFTDRAVVENISEIEMKCTVRGDIVLLSPMDGSTRYSVCNHQDLELAEAKVYKVSGKIYEIKPNERWPGTPFQVTSAKKK